ncbi:MAG: hypothetical protein Q8P05_05370 [Candidatus Diapherotrites archaeon]|nr:hypothetical protein [Candidatus Diapherotrites archaeon]
METELLFRMEDKIDKLIQSVSELKVAHAKTAGHVDTLREVAVRDRDEQKRHVTDDAEWHDDFNKRIRTLEAWVNTQKGQIVVMAAIASIIVSAAVSYFL